VSWASDAGLVPREPEVQDASLQVRLTPALLDRWFAEAPTGDRPSYAQHLLRSLAPDEVAHIAEAFRSRLTGKTVSWRSRAVILVASRPDA
jgi:hypothetical protein